MGSRETEDPRARAFMGGQGGAQAKGVRGLHGSPLVFDYHQVIVVGGGKGHLWQGATLPYRYTWSPGLGAHSVFCGDVDVAGR